MLTNTYLNKTTEQRFWEKVKKTKSCWHWMGTKSRGYGFISISGRMYLVHRYSYMLHYGDIPKGSGWHGICVCHACDNRRCVNPKHLFLGSHDDNIQDAVNKAKFKGENAGRAKLSQNQVSQIRFLLDTRIYSHRELAKMFNISRGSIGGIKRGLIWKS